MENLSFLNLRLNFLYSCFNNYIHQNYMLKNKIYKYFFTEIFKSFITILFALSAIAWTVRAVNFLDLVVENGHSISTYLFFSFLNITNIMTKFIPLSFLLALALSIIKFEKQNELIALWSMGLNKIKVANLFFLISFLFLLIQLCFATFITPSSLNKSRELVRQSDFDSISSIIKVNDFSDSFKNITFFVEKKNMNNEMENIFIRDESHYFKGIVADSKDSVNITIMAKKGILNNKKIILENGLIQTQNKNKEINNVNFSKTTLHLDSLTPRGIIKPKLQETPTHQLFRCLFKKNNHLDVSDSFFTNQALVFSCPEEDLRKDIISTLLRRLGMPIYIPLVALTASFILVANRKSKINFLKKYFYFIFSFLILVLAELLVRFSGFSKLHSLIYLLVPLVLMPFTYIILNQRFSSEKRKTQ